MRLSKQSSEFLGNLRVYLFSSGKNEGEIEEIVAELEDHLYEAEKQGKNIEDITGKTPKEYMKNIANEMKFDLTGWLKYIPILILGVYSYHLLGDALNGGVKYSLLELIGDSVILIIFLLLTIITFKYVASTKISKTNEYLLFALLGFTPLVLFVGLLLFDRSFETPTIHFNQAGNVATIIVTIMVFIGISVWSKTWISIILPLILFVPEILINTTNLSEERRLILTSIATPLLFLIYFLIVLKMEKRKEQNV
ncbi:HAAS domain-containing protein [Bacillus suaedae]|uniref:HAAS transmembrane region domain-containing protein n=1 Tax=Halalkalibacter suaedae TaxID=2822140 RepID=A0A941ANF4_9BACI|nr:hypothetical protein [Bacillus suaedae]MBP3951565.1 hypothetical protein [Bacillus suaedae]